MDNQHRKISGYRELDEVEIDLMNDIKEFDRKLMRLIERLQQINQTELDRGSEKGREAARWLAIGKTQVQQGTMALTRAVALPKPY
jgi:hypothetical protein